MGFRYFVLRAAQERGIGGWAKNLPDGTVEIEAEGESDALAEFEKAIEKGPPGARVSETVRTSIPPIGSTDFVVL